jgi:PAS domain S-box-containing protein
MVKELRRGRILISLGKDGSRHDSMSKDQPQAQQPIDPIYRAVVEDQTEFIVRWRRNGVRTFVNKSYCRYFGKPREELIGTSFLPLVAEEDRALVERKIASLTPDNPAASGEHRVIRPDGTTGWHRWTDRAIFDERGELVEYQSVGRDISERKAAEEELRESRELLRKLAARLEAVREEERSAIAREIHDELGQVLTGLRMELVWLRDKLPPNGDHLEERVNSMAELLDRTLEDVRKLASRLRPAILDDLGLEAAIEWQADDFSKRTGIPCRLESEATGLEPDRLRDTAVFRTLQEALTNVARHAEATAVDIRLYVKDDDELRLKVTDNGKGITREQIRSSTSLGLVGMRERVGGLRGLVLIHPAAKGGTEVSLSLPLESENEVALP